VDFLQILLSLFGVFGLTSLGAIMGGQWWCWLAENLRLAVLLCTCILPSIPFFVAASNDAFSVLGALGCIVQFLFDHSSRYPEALRFALIAVNVASLVARPWLGLNGRSDDKKKH
jgi:hypothetical protein